MTDYEKMSRALWELLSSGSDHAVYSAVLADELGMSIVTLHSIVHLMRNDDRAIYPICSCERGLYIPTDHAELERYVERLKRDAKSRLNTCNHVWKSGGKLLGLPHTPQISVFEISTEGVI